MTWKIAFRPRSIAKTGKHEMPAQQSTRVQPIPSFSRHVRQDRRKGTGGDAATVSGTGEAVERAIRKVHSRSGP
jgi:hypothetical protein